MKPNFSAAEQSLGYLFQARMALLLTLEGDEDAAVVLEGLDDVTFENGNDPRALLQLKHHIKEASLTDSSPDLWKTIRVWATHFHEAKFHLPGTRLVLITTALSPENSISYLLGINRSRNVTQASQRLTDIARTSENQELKAAFSSFLALKPEDRDVLVDAIYVVDNHPDISGSADRIRELLRLSTRKEHREPLFERLEGWWFGRVVANLQNRGGSPIYGYEVFRKIAEISDLFRPDALPIDFLNASPENAPDPEGDNRQFVAQLRAISLHSKRIEKAILDYYRAFEQRSRWVREELIVSDELERYQEKLIDEWERYWLALSDGRDFSVELEDSLQSFGREVYRWMEQTADIRIRPNVTEEYIMRGSFHMLADREDPKIYWHPKFIDRLKVILKAAPHASTLDIQAN